MPDAPDDSRARRDHRDRSIRLAAVVMAISLVWNLVGNLWLPGAWYVPANLVVAAGLVALALSSGLDRRELGLASDRLRSGLLVGGMAMIAVAIVIVALVVVPATRSFFESSDVAANGLGERWFTALVRIPLGTAVFEEVLFRSVLLAVLLRLQTTTRAVASNALLFGLWHVVPAWESVSGSGWAQAGVIAGTVVVTSVAGVLFTFLRLRSGSVVAPVIAHTATNSFAYVAAIIALEW